MDSLRQLLSRPNTAKDNSHSAVAVATEPLEKPALIATILQCENETEFETEYERVATKLGVAARPSASWRKLAAVLSELMIPVYDTVAVNKYKNWKRAQDPSHGHWMFYNLNSPPIVEWRDPMGNMGRGPSGSQYTKEIPLPVLLTAERIEDRLPGEVIFYVDSYHVDPFLVVTLKADATRHLFYVERWDEPGFRGVGRL